MAEFVAFPKIARLSRDMVITEKLDGTNAQVEITEDGDLRAASRTRYLTLDQDNYGFAAWVQANRDELWKLGPGRHYGEWWGHGIYRGYGLKAGDQRFSLFNIHRWTDEHTRPACCGVVPILHRGMFSSGTIDNLLRNLRTYGSRAAPGFMNPEGIIVFHTASQTLFKKTIKGDDQPKTLAA